VNHYFNRFLLSTQKPLPILNFQMKLQIVLTNKMNFNQFSMILYETTGANFNWLIESKQIRGFKDSASLFFNRSILVLNTIGTVLQIDKEFHDYTFLRVPNKKSVSTPQSFDWIVSINSGRPIPVWRQIRFSPGVSLLFPTTIIFVVVSFGIQYSWAFFNVDLRLTSYMTIAMCASARYASRLPARAEFPARS